MVKLKRVLVWLDEAANIPQSVIDEYRATERPARDWLYCTPKPREAVPPREVVQFGARARGGKTDFLRKQREARRGAR